MTSLEHISVKHALDRLPSWTVDAHIDPVRNEHEVGVGSEGDAGDGDVTQNKGEGEEVGAGTPVTADDEGEAPVGISVTVEPSPRRHAGNQDGNDEDGGTAASASHRSLRRGASPPRTVSPSRSPSDSNSRSQSRSSVREPLGMGESSAATSWTQVDADGIVGGRPDKDDESGRRACHRSGCRSSMDRSALEEEVVDGEVGEDAKAPRDGTDAMSLPRMRMDTDEKDGAGEGDASRKEEVLVMQEDIGEGWCPLRYNGKARSQEDGEDDGRRGEGEEDAGSLRAPESDHEGDLSLEMDEKDRWRTFGSSGSRHNAQSLRLEFKSSTPQPWEDIEPPTDNTYASDYYSTLNSKKFGMLQKSRRRPLIPHSSYYFGPPPPDSAYGTPPVGQIGVHHPREIVRVERDYTVGELTQFSPVYPLELEGRITPTQFHQTVNDINEILISAHCIRHAFVYNCLTILTLQLSSLFVTSHYTKEMRRLKQKIEELNTQLYNPVGLNILWPENVAFLFMEIEYY